MNSIYIVDLTGGEHFLSDISLKVHSQLSLQPASWPYNPNCHFISRMEPPDQNDAGSDNPEIIASTAGKLKLQMDPSAKQAETSRGGHNNPNNGRATVEAVRTLAWSNRHNHRHAIYMQLLHFIHTFNFKNLRVREIRSTFHFYYLSNKHTVVELGK
jgi:hypothetical protein